jgi:hypothetical protein
LGLKGGEVEESLVDNIAAAMATVIQCILGFSFSGLFEFSCKDNLVQLQQICCGAMEGSPLAYPAIIVCNTK